MNLITEYQKRHKDCSIPICHNGVCFFNKNNKPGLIVSTSLACRSFSTCIKCDDKDHNVIVEFFTPASSANLFNNMGHYHVDPCSNLITIMNQFGILEYVPFYTNSVRDLEIWLWQFCSQYSRMRGLKAVESDKRLKNIEQMVHAAKKHPKIYNAYYIIYEQFLPSRKYLLFE